MFQYEYEKRPPAVSSSGYPGVLAGSSRGYPRPEIRPPTEREKNRARRPLPPRPVCTTMPTKTTVPLKVWIIASASCFAVCAALVLATVVITKWGSETYSREVFTQQEPIYSNLQTEAKPKQAETTEEPNPDDVTLSSEELEEELQFPILEKLAIFKNIVVANRDKNKRKDADKKEGTLISKQQLHPVHDAGLHHVERKIEKKDQPKYTYPETRENKQLTDRQAETKRKLDTAQIVTHKEFRIPNFKPTLPDVKMVNKYISHLKSEVDYEEYYNDENLYDDYMQSNTMTSYLIEKVQELHEWIMTDPDFDPVTNGTKSAKSSKPSNDFGQLLKALNESLIEGNVTIVMNKLKDIYFGENYTHTNHSRKVILSNSTDLLSFGILTLDVMLLHNIQLMAWENQETARVKMMRDPDVFAFNALFIEPTKVEARQAEVHHQHDNSYGKRNQNVREDDFDIGKNLLENVLEMGMSTARAAIHLGRAYKNTKIVLSQLSNNNRDTINAHIQGQISRNSDANTHALTRLQSSFNASAANMTYTELDCVWLLYCKNLIATTKLAAPYGTMARINGMALRMLTGELAADKALDTMLYEALAGWTELRCADMFPRCSKADAATVVMESILAPVRKSQFSNRAS